MLNNLLAVSAIKELWCFASILKIPIILFSPTMFLHTFFLTWTSTHLLSDVKVGFYFPVYSNPTIYWADGETSKQSKASSKCQNHSSKPWSITPFSQMNRTLICFAPLNEPVPCYTICIAPLSTCIGTFPWWINHILPNTASPYNLDMDF